MLLYRRWDMKKMIQNVSVDIRDDDLPCVERVNEESSENSSEREEENLDNDVTSFENVNKGLDGEECLSFLVTESNI